jgi:hypothetical protein
MCLPYWKNLVMSTNKRRRRSIKEVELEDLDRLVHLPKDDSLNSVDCFEILTACPHGSIRGSLFHYYRFMERIPNKELFRIMVILDLVGWKIDSFIQIYQSDHIDMSNERTILDLRLIVDILRVGFNAGRILSSESDKVVNLFQEFTRKHPQNSDKNIDEKHFALNDQASFGAFLESLIN